MTLPNQATTFESQQIQVFQYVFGQTLRETDFAPFFMSNCSFSSDAELLELSHRQHLPADSQRRYYRRLFILWNPQLVAENLAHVGQSVRAINSVVVVASRIR